MGGFFAIAWTDLLQGILMIGTLVILPIVGIIELQNYDRTFYEVLNQVGESNSSYTMGKSGLAALSVVLGGMSWGLGYLGQPHLVIRYMAIRSPRDIKKAKLIAILWALPGILGAFFIGLVALNYFGPNFFMINDVEQAMPLLAAELLPPILAGLLISGAVAAMMSTADSQLLVSTSAITEDFIHQYLGLNLSEKTLLLINRITIIILGLLAFFIAIFSELTGKNIFGVVSYAWSGLGSSFGPVLVLSLWWSSTTRKGVIAGLLAGFISTIIWANTDLRLIMSERLVSFVLAFIVIILVSYFDKGKS